METVQRERGVRLRMLDLTAIKEYARKAATDEGYADRFGIDPEALKVEFSREPYALGVAPDGTSYVVCSEGVGWEVSAAQPFEIGVYVSHGNSFAMMPSFSVRLDQTEVNKVASGEWVDLADLIRTFGARLERNFEIWHSTLTEQPSTRPQPIGDRA